MNADNQKPFAKDHQHLGPTGDLFRCQQKALLPTHLFLNTGMVSLLLIGMTNSKEECCLFDSFSQFLRKFFAVNFYISMTDLIVIVVIGIISGIILASIRSKHKRSKRHWTSSTISHGGGGGFGDSGGCDGGGGDC